MPFSTPTVYESGRLTTNWVGNGRSLTSTAATELAAFVNMLMSRRRRILLCAGVEPNQVAGVAAASRAFFGGFRTGPEVRVVTAWVIGLPADNASTGVIPRGYFILQPDPAAPGLSFTQPTIHMGKRNTGTVGASDLFFVEQRWDGRDDPSGTGGTTLLSANTEYFVAFEVVGYARAMSILIFEEPFSTFKDSTLLGVGPSNFITGAPLLDTPFDRIGDRLLTLWKTGGATIFTLTRQNSTNITTTSTSYVNALDSSFTAYNANAPGFWAFPEDCGSYHSDNVPVQFAVTATDTGNGGSVQFVTSGSTLATIDIDGSVGSGYYTATANLDATQTAQKIDILIKTTGANTMSLQFASCYSYEA